MATLLRRALLPWPYERQYRPVGRPTNNGGITRIWSNGPSKRHNWDRVDSCQEQKARLQLTITELTDRAETDLRGGPQWITFNAN